MTKIALLAGGKTQAGQQLLLQLQRKTTLRDVKLFRAERPSHLIELTSQAVAEKFTHFICLGGDGTVNEVVNGLMNAKELANSNDLKKIRVGVFPCGSGNDFARTLRLTTDENLLIRSMEEDSFRTVDVGVAEFHSPTGAQQRRYFINIADVGIGGRVAESLSRYPGWLGAGLKYKLAIFSSIVKHKNQEMRVAAHDLKLSGKMMAVVVANGRYFGNGLGIAPDAVVDDGLFSLVAVGDISIIDYLKNTPQAKKCKRIEHAGFQYHTASNVTVTSDQGVLPIDMDGEFVGYSPVKFSMVRGAINILTGASR